jgi:membrane protease YdiL (CAAX protease family)
VAQFDQPAAAGPAAADPGQAPAAAAVTNQAVYGGFGGPGGPGGPGGQIPAISPPAPETGRISLLRALGELGAVYAASFGLGIVSAIVLLRDPNFNSGSDAINDLQSALIEIFNYVMQAAVVIFGVGYFSLRRGLSLTALFGRFKRPAAYSANPYNAPWPPAPAAGQVAPWGGGRTAGYQGYPGFQGRPAPGYGPPGGYGAPAGYGGYGGYGPQGGYGAAGYGVRLPAERGPGWQFARVFFLAMGGFISFLIVAVIYMDLTKQNTGAPSQGSSLWLIPVGVFVSLAAGFGEEMLITGMTVTVLEQAGFGKRAWVIYLVAICLRIPFHLYYGWAAIGVICFTVTNIWVYRRWRLLWPIVLAHAAYDFVESVSQTMSNNSAGLLILALAFTTLVMVIIIACIEGSDAAGRRRYRAFAAQSGGPVGGYAMAGGYGQVQPPLQFVHPAPQPGQQPAQTGMAGPSGQPAQPSDQPSQPSAGPVLVQPVQPPPVPQPPVLRIPDPAPPQPPLLRMPDPMPQPGTPSPPGTPDPTVNDSVQQPLSSPALQPPEASDSPKYPLF